MAESHNARMRPTSIDSVRQPIRNFSETEKYIQIRDNAKEKSTLILHCHGYPGSGKSEIVKKLAEQFPYDTSSQPSGLYVKWHIQCYGRHQEISQKLTDLLKRMREHSLSQSSISRVSKDVKENIACSLSSALFTSCVPILIIIEDITKEDNFLKDFLRCVDKRCQSGGNTVKLHIYITTRSISSVISKQEFLAMTHYQMEKITGFDKTKGINFLLSGNLDNQKEVYAASRIFERFSGSALGLSVAKAYYTETRITYSEYVEQVQTYSNEVVHQSMEEEFIRQEYGNSAEHIFQTITLPFKVDSQSSEEAKLKRDVLLCLSYLHHDKIPRAVITKCFEVLRQNTGECDNYKNRTACGQLVAKLMDYGMCSVNSNDDVCLHEVVLHAFRLCQSRSHAVRNEHLANSCSLAGRNKYLTNAIWVMGGLLTKNIGPKESLTSMHKLFRHVETLLKHVEEKPLNFPQPRQALLVNMVVSHLYETAGAISLTLPPYLSLSRNFFKSAIEILWNKSEAISLFEPNHSRIDAIATYVVEQCALSGNSLPSDFTTEYISKVFLVNELDFDFLAKNCKDLNTIKKVSEMAKNGQCQVKTIETITTLRRCGLFLNNDDYKKVFFAERLASILHCWSRVILCKEIEAAPSSISLHHSLWLSSLSHAISRKCQQLFDVPLLTEHLSYIAREAYIAVEVKDDLAALNDAKQVCKTLFASSSNDATFGNAYCDGLLVEVYSPLRPNKQNQMLRCMVKICGRLLKHSCVRSQQFRDVTAEGNEIASKLLSLASRHFHKLSSAPTSIIQCGKYYAASNDFDQAMICFETYLQKIESEKITYQFHSWAIYNYAKAVVCGNCIAKKATAIRKVEEILEDTAFLWPVFKMKDDLDQMLLRLNEME